MAIVHREYEEKNQYEKHENNIRELLKDLGVTKEEVLENTPRRWIAFLNTYTKALRQEYQDFKAFESKHDQMVIVETKFWSMCEHHLLPFFGKAYVGYIPNNKVVGVSKIVRYVQHIAMKPSIQEELTDEIADQLQKELNSKGTIVILKGFHTCVASRYDNGWMTTSALRGIFREDSFRKEEFVRLINNKPREVID